MIYIDDLMGVSIGKKRAKLDLDAAIDLCENQSGFPVEPSKVVRPTRKMDGLRGCIALDLMEVSFSVTFIEKLTARTAPLHESRTVPISQLETLVASQGYVAMFYPMLKAGMPCSYAILAMAKRQRARSATVSERFVAFAFHVAESARSQRRIPRAHTPPRVPRTRLRTAQPLWTRTGPPLRRNLGCSCSLSK